VVHKTFRLLCRRAGLEDPNTPGRPRIHDYADLRVMPTFAGRCCRASWLPSRGRH